MSYTYDRFNRLLTAQTAGTHWGLPGATTGMETG